MEKAASSAADVVKKRRRGVRPFMPQEKTPQSKIPKKKNIKRK